MVYRIVIDRSKLKHRVLKGSRLSKKEAHSFITTDINNQAVWLETSAFGFDYIVHRILCFLKSSVHHNIGFAYQFGQRSRRSIFLYQYHAGLALTAFADLCVLTTGHLFIHLIVRALNADCDICEPMCLERIYCPSTDSAKTKNNRFTLLAVVAINAFKLQGVYYRAIPSHLIVLIKCVGANLTAGRPNKHILQGNHSLLAINRRLGDFLLLYCVRITPQYAAFTKL